MSLVYVGAIDEAQAPTAVFLARGKMQVGAYSTGRVAENGSRAITRVVEAWPEKLLETVERAGALLAEMREASGDKPRLWRTHEEVEGVLVSSDHVELAVQLAPADTKLIWLPVQGPRAIVAVVIHDETIVGIVATMTIALTTPRPSRVQGAL